MNIVLAVGDQHHAAADCYKIRMLHSNAPSVRQANPEGRERALMQPLAYGFCIQHRLAIVDGMEGVRKETRRLVGLAGCVIVGPSPLQFSAIWCNLVQLGAIHCNSLVGIAEFHKAESSRNQKGRGMDGRGIKLTLAVETSAASRRRCGCWSWAIGSENYKSFFVFFWPDLVGFSRI